MVRRKRFIMSFLYLFLTIFSLFMPSCEAPLTLVKAHLVETSPGVPASLDYKSMLQDEHKKYWGIFVSNYYGFDEFWLSFSYNCLDWFKPIYTGVPASKSGYVWTSSTDEVTIKEIPGAHKIENNQYVRLLIDTTQTSFKYKLSDLQRDSDMDGLSDLAENILWTNPDSNDTDKDGKADGFDTNPLAAPAEDISIEEKLHKYIIEQELFYFDSDQLVLVEQFHNKPMEYKRPHGLVLSMPSDSLDSFINANGYGVPILTAAVKDTLKVFKVSFQFFISPNDAWGYDSLYKWDDWWIEKAQLTNWEAEGD